MGVNVVAPCLHVRNERVDLGDDVHGDSSQFGAGNAAMVAQRRRSSAESGFGAALECAEGLAILSPTPTSSDPQYDLVVVGAGINGAGIARDAAGRGLRVLLVEKGDLASATSQWSTKLIHGGLRYLEQYEFRLVREALAEREIVLRQAPHIVEPLPFVLPHEPHLRPAWMLRAGLFLYDHLGRRDTLPGSFGVDLSQTKWGAGLKPKFRKGFVYSDARVDDARLVVFNVMDAHARGADVRVAHAARVRAARARRGRAHVWRVTLDAATSGPFEVTARARRQRDGTLGQGRARRDRRHAVHGDRAPRQGQPHRGPARARWRSRVHPAERRQADRLRHSVPGAVTR